jgi:hypothetical protein
VTRCLLCPAQVEGVAALADHIATQHPDSSVGPHGWANAMGRVIEQLPTPYLAALLGGLLAIMRNRGVPWSLLHETIAEIEEADRARAH